MFRSLAYPLPMSSAANNSNNPEEHEYGNIASLNPNQGGLNKICKVRGSTRSHNNKPLSISIPNHIVPIGLIYNLSSEGIVACPLEQDAFGLNKQIQRDDHDQSIMGATVYCIHHKEGCNWSDELRKLTGHLTTCRLDATPCTSQCGAKIPRLLMADHVATTCPNRMTQCTLCMQEIIFQELEAHTSSCSQEPVYCDNKCGLKVPRKLISKHRTTSCTKRLIKCTHCSKEFVFETMPAHHTKCGRYPVPCPNKCNNHAYMNGSMITQLSNGNTNMIANLTPILVPREELETHLKEKCSAELLQCAFKDAGCKFTGPKPVLEKHLDSSSSLRQHVALLCGLVSKQQKYINKLESAIGKLAINSTGTLIWRISDFTLRLAESKLKDGLELISAPFYSSQHGYKLQVSLFPNGNGSGERSHISIYIKLIPGEYDSLLKWPFNQTVSFALFDQAVTQEKACNIVESFIPDPTWANFQRPSKQPDSLGFGFPRFVSHEQLQKRNYIKDDLIFLRVKVHPRINSDPNES